MNLPVYNEGKAMSSDLMDDVAITVAQRNAMERGCKFLPHGCRLFDVEQGWESMMIGRDKNIGVADTVLTLETVLRDPDNKVIFIPLESMVTDADIEKICQRNAITKTLFREVKKA